MKKVEESCDDRRKEKWYIRYLPTIVSILTFVGIMYGFGTTIFATQFTTRVDFVAQQKLCADNNLRSAIDETRVEQKVDDLRSGQQEQIGLLRQLIKKH